MTRKSNTETGHLAGNYSFWVTLRHSAGVPATSARSGSKGSGPSAQPVIGSTETLGDGGFQDVSGLEIEMNAAEHSEGGRNDGTVRLLGRGKYREIVLKRGMVYADESLVEPEFWRWIQHTLEGRLPVVRYDGIIEVLDPNGGDIKERRAIATWRFTRALPVRVRGPDLNAKTGDVAIEELHLVHEGLTLELQP